MALLLLRSIQEASPPALVVSRDLGWTKRSKKVPKIQLFPIAESDLFDLLERSDFSRVQIIPVGRLLLELGERIKAFRPEGKGK